jgi:hypothetical protein
MTAAEPLEGDITLDVSRLKELHALLDEFHQEQRAAKPVAVTEWPPSKLSTRRPLCASRSAWKAPSTM